MARQDSRSVRLSRREAIGLIVGGGAGVGLVGLGEATGLASAWQALAKSPRPPAFPKGAVIRTILKDVPPDALGTGATWFHEHLAGALSSPPRAAQPGVPQPPPNADLIVDELRASAKDGVICVVDAAVGRRSPQQIDYLKTIATRSGVHVVVAGSSRQA